MAASNQRNLRVIVLKLTAIMGITWTLGFVLAFYPTPYLAYPFVILNSFQVCEKHTIATRSSRAPTDFVFNNVTYLIIGNQRDVTSPGCQRLFLRGFRLQLMFSIPNWGNKRECGVFVFYRGKVCWQRNFIWNTITMRWEIILKTRINLNYCR